MFILWFILKIILMYIVGVTGYIFGRIVFEKLNVRGKTGYRKYYWKINQNIIKKRVENGIS